MASIIQALADRLRDEQARRDIQNFKPRLKLVPKLAITSIPSGAKRVIRVNKKPTRQPVMRLDRSQLTRYEKYQTILALDYWPQTTDREASEAAGKDEARQVADALADAGKLGYEE